VSKNLWKQKYRNSEQARKARDLEESWKEMQKRWGVEADEKKRRRALAAEPLVYSLPTPVGRTNTHHIKSLDTGHSGPVSSKPNPQYTGTKILGIGTMHKSNAVPVFSDEEAISISSMRR
jgi:hypothetical protein